MSSKKFALKLFEKSSQSLGIEYVKTTPTKLQSWATKKEPPFIALVNNLPRSTEKNDVRNNIYSYNCVFVILGSVKKDPTIEDKTNLDIDLEGIADRFLNNIDKNENVLSITNANGEELFRGTSFAGVSYGLTFTITLADMNDYCDDWCNNSTKEIDCND